MQQRTPNVRVVPLPWPRLAWYHAGMELFQAEHIAVSYRVGGKDRSLFGDVSFALREGTVYDLVGPSGAGKSTLLRACALMMARDAGELRPREHAQNDGDVGDARPHDGGGHDHEREHRDGQEDVDDGVDDRR